MKHLVEDLKTAQAFATSWNNLPRGSIYSVEQFCEWMSPLIASDVKGKEVLELGCGNGSLAFHLVSWQPLRFKGVDLGDSVLSARKNLQDLQTNVHIEQADLVQYQSDGYDLVYCIGVLHHLINPELGFQAILRNTKPGGRFHIWVYAKEGNALVRYFVDPLRKIAATLPWWITKYCLATPLAIPFFFYSKFLKLAASISGLKAVVKLMPMSQYCLWIANREFAFFRHVAFDQLVTPQTTYIEKRTVEKWLKNHSEIEQGSCYIIFRNENSWKFGGKKSLISPL